MSDEIQKTPTSQEIKQSMDGINQETKRLDQSSQQIFKEPEFKFENTLSFSRFASDINPNRFSQM